MCKEAETWLVIPSAFREKADFWRYTAMLTNPTTHIRNIGGNALQAGARTIKDCVGAMIERAVIKDPNGRTKALLGPGDKALKRFAEEQYRVDQDAAMGHGKYSDAPAAGIEREIAEARKVFAAETSGTLAQKARDVLPDPFLQAVGAFNRGVQKVGDWNSRAWTRRTCGSISPPT